MMDISVENKVIEAYEKYRSLVVHECFLIVGDYALAEDCCQDAFLILQQRLEKDGAECKNIKAFLISSAKNIARQYLRKKIRERPISEGEELLFEIPDDELGNFNIKKENLDALEKSLKALPLSEWQLINLRYCRNYSCREISQILHMSEGSVRKNLNSAIKTLCNKMNQ